MGAGICGLTAAAELKALGKRAVVLDKGRSVGGRLATRRVGDGLADTGAQFFTVRGPEFGAQVAEWVAEGLVFEWSRGWSDGSLTTVREGHPRYAVKGGMNQVPRRLAQGLSIRLLQVITAVRAIEGGWQVELANGERTSARAILLTPPVPQSLDLLKEGGVQLPAITLEELNRIEYDPCICGLFTLSRSIDLPSPGAVQRPHANLQWVADNHRKGISPNAIVLTAQASPTYSRALWSADDDTILKSMKLDLMPFVGEQATILSAEVKRWRYASPKSIYPEPLLTLPIPLGEGQPATMAFAGDAFGAARVEGAYLSGKAAAHALAEALA